MRVAAASSSKNANLFLEMIRLDSFAERARDHLRLAATRADAARVLRRERVWPGLRTRKAPPEMFLTAAHELGVAPEHAIVIEDAAAGVEAAKAGGWRRSESHEPTTPAC